jgi:hypothetical protein
MNGEMLLHLRFKGARTYVQGPDIHDAVCAALAAHGFRSLTNLDLIFHRMVHTQSSGQFLEDAQLTAEKAHAVFRFVCDGARRTLLLAETGTPILERTSYDEAPLVAPAHFDLDARTVAVSPPPGYSNAEIVVGLNKALLARAFPEAKGKWLFTRLQLARSFFESEFRSLEVRFVGHSNFRITSSALVGDGESLGTLYFSLLRGE